MNTIKYQIPKKTNETYYKRTERYACVKYEVDKDDRVLSAMVRCFLRSGRIVDSTHGEVDIGEKMPLNDYAWDIVTKEEANKYLKEFWLELKNK